MISNLIMCFLNVYVLNSILFIINNDNYYYYYYFPSDHKMSGKRLIIIRTTMTPATIKAIEIVDQ